MLENSLSPFFRCKSEKKLANLLCIDYPKAYMELKYSFQLNTQQKYINWIGENNREFFKCSPSTKRLHKRITKIMQIETAPTYLQSGVKYKSYLTNAKQHKGQNYFLLIDIKSFFPSITKNKIKRSLVIDYAQSVDVAEFLSNAITAPQIKSGKRALVTGSPVSQYASYYVNKRMYDELASIAFQAGITFSVYVDDIAFSSKATIPFTFLNSVFKIIKKNKFKLANNKVYWGKVGQKAEITGVKITAYGLFLTEKRKERIRFKRDLISVKQYYGMDIQKEQLSLSSSIHQAMLLSPKYNRYLSLINNAFTENK